MIKKNILAISLLGVFGLSHAADVENLRIISYLNEPLRLQADVIGEGEIKLAAPTEYLRLNHPIPSYDLSVDIVENNGQKQLVLVTTEEIESPALTLLLESRDDNNRRQLFELPILLDFKPEPQAVVESITTDSEIVVDGETIDPTVANTAEKTENVAPLVEEEATVKSEAKVALSDVPAVNNAEIEKPVKQAVVESPIKEKAVSEKTKENAKKPVATKSVPVQNNALIKKYGPVTAGETLWSIANKVRPSNVTPQKMIDIIKENNPSAFTSKGVLRANVTLIIPTGTEPVEHKFVKPTENERVGYIYELPEPPVIENAVAETSETEEEPATVKVVHPVNANNAVDSQEFSTLAPATDLPVDSIEVTQPDASVEEIQVPEVVDQTSTPETNQPESEVVNNAPVTNAPEVQQVVEETAPVEKVEPPKPRPVYVVAEPEVEPSIIDLIFENIIYVGAGILVLILAVLAIVLRRRKSHEAPKKKSDQPNKPSSLAAQKEEELKAVASAEQQVQQPEQVANDTKVTPVVAAAAIATATTAIAATDDTQDQTVDPEEITTLNFDLSFTDNVSETDVKEEKDDQDVSVLDFTASLPEETLSPDNSTNAALEQEQDKETNEYGGLDFDLSFEDAAPVVESKESEENNQEFDSLDFDLSSFSSTEVDSPQVEEVASIDEMLNFDLATEVADEQDVLSLLQKDDSNSHEVNAVDNGSDLEILTNSDDEKGFGENNPIFSTSQHVENLSEASDNQEDHAVIEEYISFPDLLTDAETTLDKDELAADKPADFDHLVEDHEAELANLIETSKQVDQESHPKLDFSFVAETDEHENGLAFLDTLEVADEVQLEDPISLSVKDNVAKADSYSQELAAAVPEEIELPVVSEEDVSSDIEPIELLDFNEFTENEPTVEIHQEPEIEHIELLDIPEFNMVEDVQLHEVMIEPTIEPVLEENASLIDDASDEPALIEEEIPVVVPEVVVEEIEPIVIEEPVIAPVVDNSVDEHDFESEQVKLELALAYMDFDKGLAKPLLDEVVTDGNAEQIALAQKLLAKID